MQVTAQQLNRATLERQLLVRRETLKPVEAVRHVVALQAQEPASPYLALWNRIAGFDPTELDAAFAGGEVVKASLMRITLHAVHADDYPTFQAAMAQSLRASRVYDRRFTTDGLTPADADAAAPHLMAFAAEPHNGADIEQHLRSGFGDAAKRLWWALRTFAPLRHVPTTGPWSFGSRPSFVAAHSGTDVSREEAIQELIRRYLAGFGPASVQDIGQFTLLTRKAIKEGVRALVGELQVMEGPDGSDLVDLADAELPSEDLAAPPRLLPMWDSVLLAYADRSRVVPPAYRRLIARNNGDTLATLLVDGHVAGVWRAIDGGIEASAFHSLSDEAWDGLEKEAGELVSFLADRDPQVYRRYGRWWNDLPSAEFRLLPG